MSNIVEELRGATKKAEERFYAEAYYAVMKGLNNLFANLKLAAEKGEDYAALGNDDFKRIFGIEDVNSYFINTLFKELKKLGFDVHRDTWVYIEWKDVEF